MYLTCIRKSMTFDATKWHTKMCNSCYTKSSVGHGPSYFMVFFHEWKKTTIKLFSQISVWNIIFLNEMEKHWHPIFHRIWGENAQKIIKCPFALFLRDLKKITEGGFS